MRYKVTSADRDGASVGAVSAISASVLLSMAYLLASGCTIPELADENLRPILLEPHDVIELPKYRRRIEAYACRRGILICGSGGSVTQQCTCLGDGVL